MCDNRQVGNDMRVLLSIRCKWHLILHARTHTHRVNLPLGKNVIYTSLVLSALVLSSFLHVTVICVVIFRFVTFPPGCVVRSPRNPLQRGPVLDKLILLHVFKITVYQLHCCTQMSSRTERSFGRKLYLFIQQSVNRDVCFPLD